MFRLPARSAFGALHDSPVERSQVATQCGPPARRRCGFEVAREVALQGRGDVLELLLIDADVDVFVLERVAVSARAPRELAGNVHDVFSKQQLNTNAGSHAALTVLVGQRRDRGGKPRAPAGNGKAGGYPPLPTGGRTLVSWLRLL